MAKGDLTPQEPPYLGRWWWPEEPNNIAGGELTLTDEIWGLTLFGWVGPWDYKNADFIPTVLHGQVGTTPVTIMDIVPGGWTRQDVQPPHEARLSMNTVLVGDHVDESVRAQRAELRLHNLNEWANRMPWTTDHNPPKDVITFTPPAPKVALVDGATISLDRTWGQRTGLSAASMESNEVLLLDFSTPQDLEQLLHDWVRPLLGLLELATGTTSAVLDLKIWPPDSDQYQTGITALSSLSRRGETPARNWFQMLFCLNDVDFETFIPAFWSLHTKLGIVFDLLTAIKGRGYVSSQFMAAASAVEAYHRRQFEKQQISDEHSQRIGRIVSAVSEQDRAWLKERLAFSHEPSFADRIDGVIERAGPLFPNVVGDLVGDLSKWWKWVKDGRNSIAHRDPGMLDVDSQWRTTIRVTETIRWLLILTLLRDLGLSDGTIEAQTRQERGLQSARDHLKTVKTEWFT